MVQRLPYWRFLATLTHEAINIDNWYNYCSKLNRLTSGGCLTRAFHFVITNEYNYTCTCCRKYNASSKECHQLHSADSAHMAKPAKSHQVIFCKFITDATQTIRHVVSGPPIKQLHEQQALQNLWISMLARQVIWIHYYNHPSNKLNPIT